VRLREALTEQGFELGPVARGPYLYRWGLGTDLREVELGAIAGGELAATGARFTGRRL
jgi:hypothetical protein